MKIDKLSLPHPVLGLGDDVKGSYQVSSSVKLGKERIAVTVNHGLVNETIEKLMEDKIVAFCTEINCPQTLFRESFTTFEPNQIIEIDSTNLRDKVDVRFYVTAKRDISGYSIVGANPDYQDSTFEIAKGDVLAYGGDTSFIAAKRWEELKSISSFLVIMEGSKEEQPFEIYLNSDKIIVYLSKKDYAVYKRASKHGFDPIFHSSIVVPALSYALQQTMTAEGNPYENLKWHQVLEFRKANDQRLEKIEWSPEYAPKIAQILLENPFTRTLNRIENIIDTSFSVEF